MGVFESEEIPNIGVSCKVLYFSSNNQGRTVVTTSSNAKYLDVRINTDLTSDEDIKKILTSIKIAEGKSTTPYSPYRLW